MQLANTDDITLVVKCNQSILAANTIGLCVHLWTRRERHSENWIKFQTFSFKKMRFKMLSARSLLLCFGVKFHYTVYPKKYAHGFCFAVLCGGYTWTDFPISIRLTSLALWQSNDCPSASKATLMNMDKYFMWIHYERLHNHNKAKHNKTVCIFLGIYCTSASVAIYNI